MFKTTIKYLLLTFILAFLLVNIVQDVFVFKYSVEPLVGYASEAQADTFSWKKWYDGVYAEKNTNFLNENFGFRNTYVRIDNQIRFWLYKETRVSDLSIEKDNYLFQEAQTMEYSGTCFVGGQAIKDTVAKLVQLRDKLQSLEKKLLVVLAPSKVRLYPEYFDERKNHRPSKNCNYEFYKKALNAANIEFIDFNNWYRLKKDTSRYQLMPQFGEHWSRLEAVRAADTILKRFSFISGFQLPEIKITRIIEKDTLETPDDDGIKLMNLFWNPPFKKMAYPEFEILKKENATRSILVISDSFWRDICTKGIPGMAFKNNEFWFYAKDAFGTRLNSQRNVADLDIKRKILENDYVLIIVAESNLCVFGFGFIGKALNALNKEIAPTPEEIAGYRNVIVANPQWLNNIKEGARKNKIPLDTAIMRNVNYMFQLHGPIYTDPTVADIIIRIKSNRDWYEQIKKHAEQSGQNLDTALKNNAIFVIEEAKRNKQ